MHYLNISFTHKNSTMEIREKLPYPNENSKHGCLKLLTSSDVISEAILISTCNRMEVVCNCTDIEEATIHILTMLSRRAGIDMEVLRERADVLDDSTALYHLFSVAASLDSMVLGETQIVGQLKDAFRFAYDNGYCAQKLARVMKNAFKTAADVRNKTSISSKPVSMASAAVHKMSSILPDLKGKKALIIGVGEMSEITAKHLQNTDVEVYIANRTKHKAEILAKECLAKVADFEKLPELINEFDIIYTATSSHEPIITDAMIDKCDFKRYWFDLALPRDIQCEESEEICLVVIDDLKSIVDENLEFRKEAARAAHGIIGRAVVQFFEWLSSQDIEPIIKELYIRADKAAQEEAQRVMHAGYIPKEYEQEAQKMCEQAIKKFLHELTTKMRHASEDAQTELISGAMSTIMKDEEQH